MRAVRRFILLAVALVVSQGAGAQYYDTGASPAGVKYRLIESDSVRIITPSHFEGSARRALHYMEAMRPSVDFGLDYGVGTKIPVVFHAANSASNGLSIWAPRRMELGGMPSEGGQSTPWLKHLTVHEYRHVAQYAALNRGIVKGLSYLLGEQALLLGSGLMPFWWLEGDATEAETQMTTFGRALQPSFTMHYRAVGRKMLAKENPDVWFGGSYNGHVPSHYHLGYQLVSTANTLAGEYVWDEVVDYAVRYPYTIFATELGMRRRLGYSTRDLFYKTFERLNDHWESLPERSDSAERIVLLDSANYTTYRHPLWLDNERLVVLKGDYNTTTRFVEVDTSSGRERTLFHIGYLHSRPAIVGGRLYWCEMQQLSSFAQHMGAVLCSADIDGKNRSYPIGKDIYALYPTEFDGQLAYGRYNPDGSYSIVCSAGEMTLADGMQLCGLAAQDEWLYYITLGGCGMAIERVRPSDWRSEIVKMATKATLSDLRAEGGRLYFGSTYSGYDEVHSICLETLAESRLTTSRYGSFYGSPSPDGERLALATYDASGYGLALSSADSLAAVGAEWLPCNVVNPATYRWEGVKNVDDENFGAGEHYDQREQLPSKPYRKALGLMNFHSWAPIYYLPDQLMGGNLSNVGIGLMATSQSLLNTAFTTVGYRFVPSSGNHLATLNFKYVGWAPKVELSANLSSTPPQSYPLQGIVMEGGEYYKSYDFTQNEPPQFAGRYYSLYGRVSLPIVLGHSHFTHTLTPAVEFSHTNDKLFNPYTLSFSTHTTAVAATVQWNGYVRQALRDLQPRLGAALIVGCGKSLSADLNTPTTIGAFARFYLPGFGANDGFMARVSYQDILGRGPLNYALNFSWLTPRGSHLVAAEDVAWPDSQVGGSLQYSAPLCYPDVGVTGVMLLKRVRYNLFVDALVGKRPVSGGVVGYRGYFTTGADLYADTSWFRLPEQADVSLRLSCYYVPIAREQKVSLSVGANISF